MKDQYSLFVESDEDSEDGSGLHFFVIEERQRWYTNDDQVNLGKVDITFTLPENLTQEQIREKAIQTFREKQVRIIALAEKERVRLQGKIDKLLLLEYKPIKNIPIE